MSNKKYVWYGILLVVAMAIVSIVLFTNGTGEEQTITVEKKDFLQQISISGKVIAAKNVDLAFSQTGRVSEVYAAVGNTVAVNSVLASIENGDERAAILQKEASLMAAKAVLNELRRGSRPEELAISQAKVVSAEANLADAKNTLKEKISDLFIKSDDAVRTQADQFLSNPNTVNPKLIFTANGQLEQDITVLRVELEELLAIWNVQVLADTDLDVLAQTSLSHSATVKTFLEKTALALSTLQASPTFSQATVDGWKTDISSARTSVSTATNNLVSAVGDVASTEAALSLAQKELELEEAGVTNEDIEEQEAKVKVAEAELVSAQAKYQKTLIRAPFSGVISQMDAKVGSVATSNTPLISMISADTLQIESFVPEINAPFIEIEDPALITLDAYGEHTFFEATVTSTDPAETIRDGVSTYRAKLDFNEKDPRIKSGMTANIVITTEEKENVITVPQGIVRNDDGKQYVTVVDGEVASERVVTTGSVSSLGEVEILSGLNAGELILLSSPEQ